MSRNTEMNSVLEMEENNGYGICKEPLTCRQTFIKLAIKFTFLSVLVGK